MADYYWTDVIITRLHNFRTGYYRQDRHESLNMEVVLQILKSVKEHLEPLFTTMEIYHHTPLFVEGGQSYPSKIDRTCNVVFGSRLLNPEVIKSYIQKKYPWYTEYKIDYHSFASRDFVSYVHFIDDNNKVLRVAGNCYDSSIMVEPETLRQVYPDSGSKENSIPGIKNILEPTRLVQIPSKDWERYIQRDRYIEQR